MTTNTPFTLNLRNRDEAITALCLKVFGAEPVYDDAPAPPTTGAESILYAAIAAGDSRTLNGYAMRYFVSQEDYLRADVCRSRVGSWGEDEFHLPKAPAPPTTSITVWVHKDGSVARYEDHHHKASWSEEGYVLHTATLTPVTDEH